MPASSFDFTKQSVLYYNHARSSINVKDSESAQLLGVDWPLPFYIFAVVGSVVFILGNDGVQLVICFLVAPFLLLVGLLLLAMVAMGRYRQQCCWLIGAVAFFFLSSFALITLERGDPQCIRSTVRWLIFSQQYKAEVLATTRPNGKEFAHVEWDGWGFVPAGNTTMYLVYDPSNSLSAAAQKGGTFNPPGLQCQVDRVHRLESRWYTVLFPTDSDWRDCALTSPVDQSRLTPTAPRGLATHSQSNNREFLTSDSMP